MPSTTWSTDGVGSRESFDYWREAVCRTVLNVSMEHRPAQFSAAIHARRFGALRFAAFDATAHDVVRRPSDIARAAGDHYLVSLQRRGRSHIEQDNDTFALDPGEIAILDGDRPFRVAFPAPVARILALIPRRTLEARAPWLRGNAARKIALTSPFAGLARLHLQHLAEREIGTDAEAELLADNLCNLLALATQRERPDAARVTLATLIAHCRQNLTDPGLSPAKVAAHFGISLRTLHLRFAGSGRTFGAWLLENRLELARRMLADGRAGTTVAAVAFGCGFRDLSHFNRSFRARFAMRPGDCRAAGGPARI